MSMDDRDWAMVRREIALMASIIMHGQTAATQSGDQASTEDTDNCPPGAPTIEGRGVMHPYGFASRAKKGTISVVARVGNHPANKLIIGHRDKERPALENDGDVCLYDQHGNVLMLKDEKPYIDTGDREFSVGGKDLPDSKLGALAALCKQELEALRATINANKAIYGAMILPSGMGPVGPPPVPMQDANAINDVKCDHVRLG